MVASGQHDLEQYICDALKKDNRFVFTYLPGHITIKIRAEEQHIWSPQLTITMEEEDNQVLIRGLYGPNPTLWAFFFFGYAALSILTLFIGMWGLSLLTLGKNAVVLWAIPVLGAIAVLMYLSSQAGQKLGAQQMFDIHHFYEDITKNKVVVN